MLAMRQKWTRDELVAALYLYCTTPFSKIDQKNPQVIELAALLERSPAAVAWKLANFAALDPELKKRGVKGAANFAKADQEIWQEFFGDWNKLLSETPKAVLALPVKTITKVFPKGEERLRLTKTRVYQQFFRASVLASYEFQCCITGLAVPELLNASHIVPWSENVRHRTDPSNGLCLNTLHDRAFDRGYLTITTDYCVQISPRLNKQSRQNQEFFWAFDGVKIHLPKRFFPKPEFLEYHNHDIFKS